MGACSAAHSSNEMALYQLCTLILPLSDEVHVVDPHLILSLNYKRAQTNDLSFLYLFVRTAQDMSSMFS